MGIEVAFDKKVLNLVNSRFRHPVLEDGGTTVDGVIAMGSGDGTIWGCHGRVVAECGVR